MKQKIRVLLVDDHSIVRFGYCHLLSKGQDIEVVAEAENCAQALEYYRKLEPDVVILDLSMPLDNRSEEVQSTAGGFEAIRRIRSFDIQARILVVSGLDSHPYPQRALQAGVLGYVTKRTASAELLEAITQVAQGQQYFSRCIQQVVEGKGLGDDEERLSRLTSRELEIFTFIAEGRSVNQIAEVMHLSPKTVHAHRANLMRKLDIGSNVELLQMAVRAGIMQT